ncbi:hypothetical protein L6E12_03700 [Actinokineospora sp. PR83]|uniref:hypothetical protein n=1 Tax=Actinokineospora sp. PR83 TaxID=2884908 RepID=UPI001F21CE8C|nr:hypothetical protein [Actinokineospora sp. PR83]MCG8914893.1 hypothetical protein [Actinokineospora sp. PR83]
MTPPEKRVGRTPGTGRRFPPRPAGDPPRGDVEAPDLILRQALPADYLTGRAAGAGHVRWAIALGVALGVVALAAVLARRSLTANTAGEHHRTQGG